MGYIKVKKASGFDLVSADNVGDVKLATGCCCSISFWL
jgi:hypothetical protein